jgi:hypothetical protein
VLRRRSLIIVWAVASVLAAGIPATEPRTARASLISGDIPQRPPVVTLVSKSPPQRGVWGSFCVFMPPDEEGSSVGLCADFADDPEPRRLSVVRPGERVTMLLRKTTSASGRVSVYARGCEDRPARRTFEIKGRRTSWVVPRRSRPGRRFELALGFEFETVDGRRGDTEASLGMLVSKTRDRALVRNRDSLDCGEPD